jgi:hypothetical protein
MRPLFVTGSSLACALLACALFFFTPTPAMAADAVPAPGVVTAQDAVTQTTEAEAGAGTVTVTSARRVSDVVNERQPAFSTLSPDGQFIAWYTEAGRGRNREQSICLFTFANAGRQCFGLPQGEFNGFPYQLQWSPDSTAIAFSENPLEVGNEADIWLMNAADGAFTNLTDDGLTGSWRSLLNQGETPLNLDYLPAWNAADGAIYFWRVNPTDSLSFTLSLQRIDPAGGEPELVADLAEQLPGMLPLFDFQAIYLDGPSSVAPDGSKLAAILGSFSASSSTQFALYLFDLTDPAAAPQEVIGPDAWADAVPAWQSMPTTPLGLAWRGDSAGLVAAANSVTPWTPFMVFYYVDSATGEKTPVVDFSGLESSADYSAAAPGRELPWRFFSPWTASLAPAGESLLMLQNLGGVIGMLVADLPPDGELPPLVQTADSFFSSTMTQSSRSSNGLVLMYGLLLTVEQGE